MVFRGRVYKKDRYQAGRHAIAAARREGTTFDADLENRRREASSPELGDFDVQSTLESPVNPFLHATVTGNSAIILQKAKVALLEYVEPLAAQLEYAQQTFYQYVGQSDPDDTGWLSLDAAIEILVSAGERSAMLDDTAAAREDLTMALSRYRRIAGEEGPSEEVISIRLFFFVCTSFRAIRKVAIDHILTLVRRAARSAGSSFSVSQPGLTRDGVFELLPRLLVVYNIDLTDTELQMIWEECEVQQRHRARKRTHSTQGVQFLVYSANKLGALARKILYNPHFQNVILLCIVVNTLNLSIGDPLCGPVDENGESCSFMCAGVRPLPRRTCCVSVSVPVT